MLFGRGKYIICYVELILFGEGLVVDMLGFSLLEFLMLEVEELINCFFEMLCLSE